MKEIRIHGRGGQGAVLAAELLAIAAFGDGKFGQAFPAFGGERRGAPVQAFVRLDSHPIRVRYRVNQPDCVVILDASLLKVLDMLHGLRQAGVVLVNTEDPPADLAWSASARVFAVPATRIAMEVLGQPFVNPAMLGALAAATGEVSLSAVQQAFQDRFPGSVGAKNGLAARRGFEFISSGATGPVAVVGRAGAAGGAAALEDDQGLGAPGRPLHFAAVVAPRTSLAYPTGDWRYSRPVMDPNACNGCGVCATFCPDGCMFIEEKKAVVDLVYCKGCGICAQECSRAAIRMLPEEV